MEESFSALDFDAKKWLISNLELATPDSLDIQLSELNFNLDQYKHKLEESITSSELALQTKEEKVEENLKEIMKEYEKIQNLFDSQLKAQDNLSTIKVNEDIFTEISEISTIKSRLNDTLQMMDLIMSLDFHLDEILVFLEERNLQELEIKIENLKELFNLISKLPFLDSRREKYETIVQKIKEYATQILLEKFQDNERIHSDLCSIYKILKIVSMEYLFLEYYNRARFDRIFKNFTEAAESNTNENLDFLEIFCETIKKEIEYLSDLCTYKLADVMSELLTEGINRILKFLIDNYYLKYFNQNKYQEKNLDCLGCYLKIAKFLSKQIEQGIILNKKHIVLIEKTCFSLFIPISHNLLKAEFEHNSKILLKKLRKTSEKTQENESFEEKISEFNFLKLPDIIHLSFQRVHELLFGTELDEWVIGIHKISEELFQKFQRLLDELEFRNYNHEALDTILVFSKSLVKKDDIFENNENLTKKFPVSENLSMIELLLNKYEEICYLEELMNKMDKEIRVLIIENITNNFQDIFIKIQGFLIENNSSIANKRKNLILSLKTGLVIFEGIFNGINKSKEKIKKILLKIFLSDSFIKLNEIIKLPIWSLNEEKPLIMNFNKITDQISSVCQNFFLHMQIIEEIKNELERNSNVYNHLDHLDVSNKQDILQKLYENRLKYEIYLNDYEAQEEEINEKCDFVKFWGTIYVYFLVKIICSALKCINEFGSTGRKQLKMDIEYIANVLNEYLSFKTKRTLEEVLNYIHSNESKKVIYMRGVSQGNFDFF